MEAQLIFYIQILSALGCLQRSIEYLLLLRGENILPFFDSKVSAGESRVFLTKLNFTILEVIAFFLGVGLFFNLWLALPLLVVQWLRYVLFRGPFNGGSDSLLNLLLLSLLIAAFGFQRAPWLLKLALIFIGVQAALSYWVAGWAKLRSSWLSGEALYFIFKSSNYIIPIGLKKFFLNIKTCQWASVFVLVFELALPVIFISKKFCFFYLIVALSFHVFNAFAFGLNRFLFTWPASYPALFYLASLIPA